MGKGSGRGVEWKRDAGRGKGNGQRGRTGYGSFLPESKDGSWVEVGHDEWSAKTVPTLMASAR